MTTLPNQTPIFLRSWPLGGYTAAIGSLVSRINIERGSFRTLSEEGLRQSIANAEAGIHEGESKSSEDETEEEEEEPDREKELKKNQEEISAQIVNTREAALLSLDFISLLLSKDLPIQASTTISPALKQTVELEILAADKILAPRVLSPQVEVNQRIAKGWRLQSLNKSADSILATATRLEKSIESETRYWEQVLAISENGWAVCRVPQEKHTLGVRYGFSEAAQAFKSRSLAALRRNAEGNITLDQGVISSEPQYLRVRIEKNGIQTGESSAPKTIADDAPIEAHILQARNTIFAEELWQELNREARMLGSYGVRAKPTTISCPLTPNRTMIFDLVPLDASTPSPKPDDKIAEVVSLTVHLFLSYAHRQAHQRRSQPPPPLSSSKRTNPPHILIRPLISRILHETNLSSLHALLKPLISTLNSTSLNPPLKYTITTSSAPTTPDAFPTTVERILITSTDRLEAITTITLIPGTTLQIVSRTSMSPFTSTFHFPTILPEDSPLNEICKPPTLNNYENLREYILFASSCALASYFTSPPEEEESDLDAEGKEGWYGTSQPNILRKSYKDMGRSKQNMFDVKHDEKQGKVRVIVRWELMGQFIMHDDGGKKLDLGEGIYEWVGGKSKQDEERDDEGDLGEVVRKIEDVVEDAGTWRSPVESKYR